MMQIARSGWFGEFEEKKTGTINLLVAARHRGCRVSGWLNYLAGRKGWTKVATASAQALATLASAKVEAA